MKSIRKSAIVAGYRSGLEQDLSEWLSKNSTKKFKYEIVKLKYVQPETKHTYTPDFSFDDNPNMFIETKGRFVASDRKKHLLLKAQNPDLDVRFVFSRPSTRISKKSNTSYADWCEKNGFKFCGIDDKETILEWLNES